MADLEGVLNPGTFGSVLVAVLAGVAVAAAAGLRAFLPLLVVGSASRLGLFHLDPSFAFLENGVVLGALAVAAAVEIAADKIPVLDHGLDVAATFVRPAAGFVAAMAVMGELPRPAAAGLALVMAVLTLGAHVVHAKTRVVSTLTTAGIGNPFLSGFEDVASGAFSVLAVLAPVVGALMVLSLAILVWRLTGLLRRGRRKPAS